mmetsp:Transcript_25438/g.80939  ORF Transcript_25438/g.80939 Transcript_25438/m.80939 type:complete len:213 (+) Transcript_25438:942-1580(+)
MRSTSRRYACRAGVRGHGLAPLKNRLFPRSFKHLLAIGDFFLFFELVHAFRHAHGYSTNKEAEHDEGRNEHERHKVQDGYHGLRYGHTWWAIRERGNGRFCRVLRVVLAAIKEWASTAEIVDVEYVGPILESAYPPQSEEAEPEVTKVERVVFGKRVKSDDGVEVEYEEHENEDIADGLHTANEAAHDHEELRDLFDQFDNSHEAQQAQNRD